MSKQAGKVILSILSLTLLPSCIYAKQILPPGETDAEGPLHVTHISTAGKTIPTRHSVAIGNGNAGACNIVYQLTMDDTFDDGDTSLMTGAFLAGAFGNGFSCVTETYKSLNQKPVSVTYKIAVEGGYPYYNKADPHNQSITLIN